MDPSMLSKLALPKSKVSSIKSNAKLPRHKTGEKFLKGPIPLNWLCKAAQLPGKTLQVANAIWFLAGLNKNNPTVKLNQSLLTLFGVSRFCKYRAVAALSEAGLIIVEKNTGKSPVVTVLSVPEEL